VVAGIDATDIQGVAATYLQPDNRTVAVLGKKGALP